MKFGFRGALSALFVLCAAQLAACSALQTVGLNVAASVSSAAGKVAGPAPGQALTLKDALILGAAAEEATKFAIDNVHMSHSVLVELNALNDAVHAAMTDLVTANGNGQALNFEAFNAALQAFNAYGLANGIGAPPASAQAASVARQAFLALTPGATG